MLFYVIYIIKQDIYMSPIAGRMAGPNGLKICVDTHGWQGGFIGKKKIRFEKKKFQSFFPRATPGPSASYK